MNSTLSLHKIPLHSKLTFPFQLLVFSICILSILPMTLSIGSAAVQCGSILAFFVTFYVLTKTKRFYYDGEQFWVKGLGSFKRVSPPRIVSIFLPSKGLLSIVKLRGHHSFYFLRKRSLPDQQEQLNQEEFMKIVNLMNIKE